MPHSRKFILCVVMAVTAADVSDNISAKGQRIWQYFVYSMCIGASNFLGCYFI